MNTFPVDCLICSNNGMIKYYYPNVHFNDKIFSYYECKKCKSAQIEPIPNEDDFNKMYGVSDHSYLLKLQENEKINFNKTLPNYNHQKYQITFLNKYLPQGKGKTLLDIGCGSGFYMYHAAKLGYECTGIEFNKEFCKILSDKTGLNITTIDTIENRKFDVIHLGHFLEHLPDPYNYLNFIKKFTHKNTIVVIDGPLEKNPCLSRFIIKTVSLIKRKKFNTYPPQHITFTNHQSQLVLFERCGLKKINYIVKEQAFPLPEKPNLKNPYKLILFIISRISIFISKTNSTWGNIFHYAGKFE